MSLEKLTGGIIVEAEGPLGTPAPFDPVSEVASLSDDRFAGGEAIAAVELNGFVYAVAGGFHLAKMEQYDPSTNSWTTVESLGTDRDDHGAAVANGKIYAIGGDDGSNLLSSVEEYDPSADTWSSVASLPTARSRLGAAEVGGLVYSIGGREAGGGSTASVDQYDPSTNSWTSVASLPTGRQSLSATSVNGSVYAIGGDPTDSVVDQYDPSTNSWASVESLVTGRRSLAAAAANGKIYAIGGERSSVDPFASVEEYNPDNDTWSEVASLNTARYTLGAAVDSTGSIYAIGGTDSNDNALSSVEKISRFPSLEDVHSATGDTLIGIDDPDGKLLNRTTGQEVTGGTQLARDGETIAAFTENGRVYRTEET
jgi:N-acetylneuraminic acid mutarotase